jgi:hypothetical protein
LSYTLAQAALATGRDRSTLLKAIRRGTLSAQRDEATGAWRVDAAELARVYGIGPSQTGSQPDVHVQLEVERTKTTGLEARLADAQEVIRDLRARLDAEAEERRRLTMLLADQRATPSAPVPNPVPVRRLWWSWRHR